MLPNPLKTFFDIQEPHIPTVYMALKDMVAFLTKSNVKKVTNFEILQELEKFSVEVKLFFAGFLKIGTILFCKFWDNVDLRQLV